MCNRWDVRAMLTTRTRCEWGLPNTYPPKCTTCAPKSKFPIEGVQVSVSGSLGWKEQNLQRAVHTSPTSPLNGCRDRRTHHIGRRFRMCSESANTTLGPTCCRFEPSNNTPPKQGTTRAAEKNVQLVFVQPSYCYRPSTATVVSPPGVPRREGFGPIGCSCTLLAGCERPRRLVEA